MNSHKYTNVCDVVNASNRRDEGMKQKSLADKNGFKAKSLSIVFCVFGNWLYIAFTCVTMCVCAYVSPLFLYLISFVVCSSNDMKLMNSMLHCVQRRKKRLEERKNRNEDYKFCRLLLIKIESVYLHCHRNASIIIIGRLINVPIDFIKTKAIALRDSAPSKFFNVVLSFMWNEMYLIRFTTTLSRISIQVDWRECRQCAESRKKRHCKLSSSDNIS